MKKFFALAALAVILVAGVALADKTVTLLKTGSAVTSINFDFVAVPGSVATSVCGRAPLAGGGFSTPACYPITLSSGAIFTAATGLATGAALTFWQGQEGL